MLSSAQLQVTAAPLSGCQGNRLPCQLQGEACPEQFQPCLFKKLFLESGQPPLACGEVLLLLEQGVVAAMQLQ